MLPFEKIRMRLIEQCVMHSETGFLFFDIRAYSTVERNVEVCSRGDHGRSFCRGGGASSRLPNLGRGLSPTRPCLTPVAVNTTESRQ